MKSIILIAIILITLSTSAIATSWSKSDLELQKTFYILTTIDWVQTRSIINHPNKFYETNLLLGERPDNKSVTHYMLSGMLLHTAVANYLPDLISLCGGSLKSAKFSRTIWQSFWIGIETSAVTNNYLIGVKVHI